MLYKLYPNYKLFTALVDLYSPHHINQSSLRVRNKVSLLLCLSKSAAVFEAKRCPNLYHAQHILFLPIYLPWNKKRNTVWDCLSDIVPFTVGLHASCHFWRGWLKGWIGSWCVCFAKHSGICFTIFEIKISMLLDIICLMLVSAMSLRHCCQLSTGISQCYWRYFNVMHRGRLFIALFYFRMKKNKTNDFGSFSWPWYWGELWFYHITWLWGFGQNT